MYLLGCRIPKKEALDGSWIVLPSILTVDVIKGCAPKSSRG